MKHVSFLSLVVIIVLVLAACSSPAAPTVVAPVNTSIPAAQKTEITLKVFAPSSLTDAAKEIATAFEAANPGVKVICEFGHTPTQRIQFTEGATGDVFITASQKDMDDAVTDQTVAGGVAKVFAMNQLVVILPAKNPAELKTLEDLAKPGVRLLIAVSDTPIGKVTLSAFDKMDKQFGADFKTRITANIVSNESGVKPIVSKIKLGEADAGIVYITDAVSAPELVTISIPAEMNMITQLNVAPLQKSANAGQSASFAAYLVSPEGQAILKKWGFLPGKP